MLLCFIILILAVAADQITKYLVAVHLTLNTSSTVIPGVLDLTYVRNTGAAFGMLSDSRWIFMLLSAVGICAIIIYLCVKRPKSFLLRAALSFIAAGGIGNMIDRTALGYVIDFIDVKFVNFYVFNIADSCITVGCSLFILYIIISEIKAKKTATPENPA